MPHNKEEDLQAYNADISHNMLAGSLYRDTGFSLARTEDNVPLTDIYGDLWDNESVTAQIVDTTQNAFLTNFLGPSNRKAAEHWQEQAGMSLDGMYSPYSTAFSKDTMKGEDEENRRTFNTPHRNMSAFEKPYTITDEQDNDIALGAFWHVGSGSINAATLHPYPSGHNIVSMVRGPNLEDVNRDITITRGGYGTSYPRLGEIKPTHELSAYSSRAIGLRGPVVLTGWAYDTHGFPTPNAKFDANLKQTDPASDFWGMPKEPPADYVHKNPELHHTPLHLKRTDQWKSGPIDLRWDRDRKVWTGGRHNGIYLCKATKCILPLSGIDGKNSFNFGISNNIASLGRLYRNPCPSDDCEYWMYFPKSKLYPDIEIYDPEDQNWCGNCQVKKDADNNIYADCDDMVKACVPFYDAVILRSTDHIVYGENSAVDCGDKFYKAAGGSPYSKRVGNPCHGWGDTKAYEVEKLVDKVLGKGTRIDLPPDDKAPTFSETALPLLYKKVLIENPLNQGLMLGDNFLSYDTGRSIVLEYTKSRKDTVCVAHGDPVTVKEVIPIHIILQAEFYGIEMISHAGCEQGEMSACTRKFFAQGFVTGDDCGPDDDYPLTAIR